MNKLTLLFGVILCLVVVNARHYSDQREDESLENEEETLRRPREHNTQANRHRRRRWQANYGYDYSPPMYYPDRRDYDRNNQEVLQNIYRLLEEISVNVRRPPPPPLPVYIPYPVYFPQVPQVTCTPPKSDEKKPNVTNRVSDMEDSNQNWGLVVSGENDYDDGNDGARPISFDPIVPKQQMKRPIPPVEHGSVQATFTTEAPKFMDSASSAAAPGMCNAAILSCCGISNNKLQQKECFANVGCSMTYDDNVCNPVSIQRALDSFKIKYSPVN